VQPKSKDRDPTLLAAVAIVALASIVFVGIDVAGYYNSFNAPTLALLNQQGEAQLPNTAYNGTTIQLLIQLTQRHSTNQRFALMVYVSNATGFLNEKNGPIGNETAVIQLPQQPNLSLPLRLQVWYTNKDGALDAYLLKINGDNYPLSIPITHGLVGIFFQLVEAKNGSYVATNTWTNIWLNVKQ
jgi:hypothetical protein